MYAKKSRRDLTLVIGYFFLQKVFFYPSIISANNFLARISPSGTTNIRSFWYYRYSFPLVLPIFLPSGTTSITSFWDFFDNHKKINFNYSTSDLTLVNVATIYDIGIVPAGLKIGKVSPNQESLKVPSGFHIVRK